MKTEDELYRDELARRAELVQALAEMRAADPLCPDPSASPKHDNVPAQIADMERRLADLDATLAAYVAGRRG